MKLTTIDGNTGASLAAYYLSENAAIYPITPSSTMAENVDEWATKGVTNLFGKTVKVNQLQSEGGASGTLHGLALAGSLATTFTASQGLLLMIPNMYKIAGEGLPVVIHVSARAIASHALSIFGDHSDVYATRQTGFALLNSCSPQEAHDMAVISHLCAVEAGVPFLHFFDGFRTSHEIRKIYTLEKEDYDKLVNLEKIAEFKARALSSSHPECFGTAQNPDTFFQNREANNLKYKALPSTVQVVMDKFASVTGRQYKLFDYYGNPKAKHALVVMGSASETCTQIALKEGFGVVIPRLYRPFDSKAFLACLPKTIKSICVLDRSKEDGALGEPLYLDVASCLHEAGSKIKVIGGRYGLGGKDFTPADAYAVYENLKSTNPLNHFSVGINDDVSFKSLKVKPYHLVNDEFSAKIFGLGSDGTVSANKNSLKIIGENCGKHVQGYFEYDSKKSGNTTISHLRICDNEIHSPYLVQEVDFVACHHPSFVNRFDLLDGITEGGTFVLNTNLKGKELDKFLPNKLKKTIAEKKLNFYTIDAFEIADSVGLKGRINLVMQSAFFKLLGLIEFEKSKAFMKEYAEKTYGKKGKAVVDANFKAIDLGAENLVKIDTPSSWASLNVKPPKTNKNDYYSSFIKPIAELKGNTLPVSAFNPNGAVPTNTTRLEKRGIATHLPCFNSENCIGCNMCALVCPHACIRPVLVKDKSKKPEGFTTTKLSGVKGYTQRMQISPLDCTGCGLCAGVCPTRNKALTMVDVNEILDKEKENYAFGEKQKMPSSTKKMALTIKSIGYKKPYFEFSGACAGCGETPYIKILTQLFGDHLIIANATGCSSIYGANSPTCPYAKDEEGRGPAWANSLFEDNAEFGFGLYLAYKNRREKIKLALENMLTYTKEKDKALIKKYLKNFSSFAQTKVLAPEIEKLCNKLKTEDAKSVLLEKDALIKQTFWIIGGDGWAYDIGFGGLDHVLSQGEDINVLVLDTNVYSNTGGQSSKATPTSAVAKFASAGKSQPKKNLGEMFMSYKNIYVAEVALGANFTQTIQALSEAEQYEGSSIVIAYATCINQGVDLSSGMAHMRDAVDSGFLNIYRYNPSKPAPFTLDCGEITKPLKEFLSSETRFKTLTKSNPENAKVLQNKLCDLAYEKRNELIKKQKTQNEAKE